MRRDGIVVVCVNIDDRRLVVRAMLKDSQCTVQPGCDELAAIGSVAEIRRSRSVCRILAEIMISRTRWTHALAVP